MRMRKQLLQGLSTIASLGICVAALHAFEQNVGMHDAMLAFQTIVWVALGTFTLMFAVRSFRAATRAVFLGVGAGGCATAIVALAIATGTANILPLPDMDPTAANTWLIGIMTAVGSVVAIIRS